MIITTENINMDHFPFDLSMAESYMLVENYGRRSVNIHDICHKGRFE